MKHNAFRKSMDDLLTDGYLEDCHIEACAKILFLCRQADTESNRPFIYVSPNLLLYSKNLGLDSPMIDAFIADITKANLNSTRLVLMPVCYSQHWFLLVGQVPEKKWIIHDSLHNPLRKETARLDIEVLQKATAKKVHVGFTKWSVSLAGGIPQQENHVDCGVFVVKYMERIAQRGPVDWKECKDWQSQMSYFRAQICADILKIGRAHV